MAKSKKTIRKYYRKGRWSSNIKTLNSNIITARGNTSFHAEQLLCENPPQNDNSVSQQYTVKNIELSYEIEYYGTDDIIAEGLTSYIVYVPQGMTVTETYPNYHPEYIMAMRFLGSPNMNSLTDSNPGRNPLRIKTRLARRLQTGDKIVLLITGRNNSANQHDLIFNGVIRWWTKAN